MDSLTELFDGLATSELVQMADETRKRDIATEGTSLRTLPPADHHQDVIDSIHKLQGLESSNPEHVRATMMQMVEDAKPRFPPPKRLPCANVSVESQTTCPNEGTSSCSACKLVSYCSKDCQRKHWRTHKKDCNAELRSNGWMPRCVKEGRLPSFIVHASGNTSLDPIGMGMSLWGNMPAMDVINLAKTEKDANKDFSLAFIASGDLRHIVHTVNRLPETYSGKLRITFNDLNPLITLRNVIILLILGKVKDDELAADIALHFWHSVFLPMEYRLRIAHLMSSHLKGGSDGLFSVSLGDHAKLTGELTELIIGWILSLTSRTSSPGDAQNEYERIRFAPQRQDFWDRQYSSLKPSHRVAVAKYRQFGLVLPFGAINAHFNVPNASLFSPSGKWLQTDFTDPLRAWSLGEIFRAGRAHGAQQEDLYGCLYFYLSDELQLFVRRLHSLDISFYVFNREATAIARDLEAGGLSRAGIPSSMKFDRIEVSNILDKNYAGLRGVLQSWGPLMGDSQFASIVGYLMNWSIESDGTPRGMSDDKEVGKLMDKLHAMGRLKPFESMNGRTGRPSKDDMQLLLMKAMHAVQIVRDTWPPFSQYLRDNELQQTLEETRLKRCDKHVLVPHRIGAMLDDRPGSLPVVDSDESWYLLVQLGSASFLERYVEFRRATT